MGSRSLTRGTAIGLWVTSEGGLRYTRSVEPLGRRVESVQKSTDVGSDYGTDCGTFSETQS